MSMHTSNTAKLRNNGLVDSSLFLCENLVFMSVLVVVIPLLDGHQYSIFIEKYGAVQVSDIDSCIDWITWDTH